MKQLTEGQRYKLEAYLQAGKKKDDIASLLGVHRSTIYRELRRNKLRASDKYDGDYAGEARHRFCSHALFRIQTGYPGSNDSQMFCHNAHCHGGS